LLTLNPNENLTNEKGIAVALVLAPQSMPFVRDCLAFHPATVAQSRLIWQYPVLP
jgi:hypothetical protein